jgi:UDP-2,3-diacylglucosamine pyrophosphatase LpxH
MAKVKALLARQAIAPEKAFKMLAARNVTPAQLRALIDQVQNQPPVVGEHVHKWGRKRIKFGLCSDLHVGSKYADYGAMRDLFKRFEAEDIRHVYVAGDITEGYDRRKGQTYECELHGFDEQVHGAAERIPRLQGGKIHFITGDHDGWHKDNGGVHVGPHLARLRPDMNYLGDCQAIVEFTPNCRLMLAHPAKGTSYAISYQIQKMIEAFAGGTKPQLLAVGHYHKAEYIFYRNVHAFQTGCFRGYVMVDTDQGKKRISRLQPGDRVLTHTGKYQAVKNVQRRKYTGRFVRLTFGRRNAGSTLVATEEHPVMVERAGAKVWLPIAEVKAGDWVFVNTRRCRQCPARVPYYNVLCPACNPSHQESVQQKISTARGARKLVRAGKGTGWTHFEKDILPFCQKMIAEGWTMVPVGNAIAPDAIGFKEGRVVAFELERSQGTKLAWKKKKYEGAAIGSYLDEVRWVDVKPRRQNSAQNEFREDAVLPFVKVPVLKTEEVKSRNRSATVYNLEVARDHTYFASNVLVHNCLQRQSGWMKRMGLSAHMGGWIVEIWLNDEGKIDRLKQELIPYYE